MSLGLPACTSRRDDAAEGWRLRWERRQHFERHIVHGRLRQKAVSRPGGANGRRGRGNILGPALGERGRRARRQGWSGWRGMRGPSERFRVVDSAGRRLRMGLRWRLRRRHGWRGIEGVSRGGLRQPGVGLVLSKRIRERRCAGRLRGHDCRRGGMLVGHFSFTMGGFCSVGVGRGCRGGRTRSIDESGGK